MSKNRDISQLNSELANTALALRSVSIGNTATNTTINNTSIAVKSIFANSSNGTSGQVLHSNGTGIYWNDISAAATYSANVGDGATTSFNIAHNLNKTFVLFTVTENATGFLAYPDIDILTSNTANIIFYTAPSANQYSIKVIGF